MEFKKITIINILATFTGGILALFAAYNNYGYWSLVILALSKSFIQLLSLAIVANMPIGFYKFKVPIRQMIKFGIGLIGFGIVNYFARNLDNILIGRFVGAEELALYAKAYFLMFLPSMLITGALSGLMISVLAKVQDQQEKFQEIYAKVLRMIFVVTFPVTGYFLLFPEDPIFLFYGPNWDGSVLLLQILSIAAITQPLYNTMGWIYTAIGKSKEMFHWGIVSSLLLSASFFIGVQWGAVGVATIYSLIMGISFVYYGLSKAHTQAGIKLQKSFLPLFPIIGIGILSLLFVKGLFVYINIDNTYLIILLKVTLLLFVYIGFLYIVYREKLKELILIEEGLK